VAEIVPSSNRANSDRMLHLFLAPAPLVRNVPVRQGGQGYAKKPAYGARSVLKSSANAAGASPQRPRSRGESGSYTATRS